MASWNHSESSSQPVHCPKTSVQRDNRQGRRDSRNKRKHLSHDDLLFLLSILEGEVQARDEVITVLKSEKTESALLGAHYGFSRLEKVLRALQRDSLRAQQDHLKDVYGNPISELNHLIEAQKQSSKKMLGQLLELAHTHNGILSRLEEQEKSHRALIHKSNYLTYILEQDRQRLKLLIVKEKEYQKLKEEKSEREVSALKEELTKLKAFALLVVTEQQCLSELLEEQRDRVTELTALTDHIKLEVSAAYLRANEEELKSLQLEVEHPNQVSIFRKSHKTMTAKLTVEGTQNSKLREQLVFLRHQSEDLEGKRPVLRKIDAGRWELNDKERGTGGPSLLSEVEVLRRRVVEMEGKDEELMRMGDQCRDLDRRLTKETLHCRSLKGEVDRLNGRINELDRIEEALRKSKQECSSLKGSLERERDVSKMLSGELDNLRVRLRELEASEGRLEKSEAVIKHDLAQLRSLTVALVEDRKSMADRLRQTEEKLSRKDGKKNEQSNLATMTERLKEERQQAAKSKTDLEERIKGMAREKDELQARLKREEERNSDLENKITIMKRRLQVLENRREKEEKRESVKYMHSSIPINTNYHCQTEDNKVNELSQELDRLRKILRDKEALEGELMKVEEDFESLERRFKEEQSRSESLTEELEVAKRELSRYQQAEKQEVNQEHHLLCRLQREQVKSRLLSREVDTLKEKLQRLIGTEESICRVQTDHSTLQRKLTQQESRNRELAREMKELTSELDRHKRIKNLTSATNRSELHQTTKEVQTEPADSLPNDFNCKASLMHNRNVDNDEEDPIQNAEVDSSTLIHNLNSLNTANNNISVYSSHGANGIDVQPVNREVMMLTHTPGQPLHIKVTPHHILNTATLEISSPTADAATSYTSTAVIPTSGAPPKQRITIIQNSALSAVNTRSPPSSPDRSVSSSLNGSPIARVLSPASSRSVTPDHNSPIQIVTVRTCSPEPTEVTSQTGFSKTLERQSSWQHERSNSIDKSPSITTTAEDNKIHIHLGSPYIQSLNGVSHSMPHPGGPYYLRHEQRTQVLANGCHVKGVGKITSSITISPATSPATHSSNITIPLGSLQKPRLSRIPMHNGYNKNRRSNQCLSAGQNNGQH